MNQQVENAIGGADDVVVTIGSDDTQTVCSLLGILADIRQKTGVGDKVMLYELADTLAAMVKPTHTREELVLLVENIEHDFTIIGNYCANKIISALESIGAVKIKGGK